MAFYSGFAAELNSGETLAETFLRVRNYDHQTALHIAASGGRTQICKYLIQQLEVDVNLEEDQSKVKGKEHFVCSKSRGDASFHNNGYWDAIFWCTEALEAESMNAAVLSNRSLCWARLKEGDRALEDAVACISVNPGWPKAHYRAGVAYVLLQNYAGAAEKFDDALKLDPNNKVIQAALSEALQAMIVQES